jgi:diguanylate cyclase (GGDEF)-like protein
LTQIIEGDGVFRYIRKSFSAKIITLVVINVVTTSLVIGLVTMRSTESFLREKISEKFPSILVNTKGKIDLWYHNSSMDMAVLARSPALTKQIKFFLEADDSVSLKTARNAMTTYFEFIRERLPVFKEFAVLGKGNELVYWSSENVREYEEYLIGQREENGTALAISDARVFPGETEIPQWFLVPVAVNDSLTVTVCAQCYLESIEHLLVDINLSPYGDIYILDFRGCFLTQPRQTTVDMLGEKAMEVPTRQEGPMLVEAYDSYANKRVFGSKVFLPDKKWWLICEEDYKHSMGPVLTTRNKILVADLFICALFILFALKIIRSILRPVRALADGAKKVKEGMVGVNIQSSSSDEVGLMISTFNEMARNISLAKVELQSKNKILNTQNETLQEMNEKLERLSVTDGLTGLFNHRHFWNLLNSELTRANLYKGDIALIVLDVDDFKKINDHFGHSVGDLLLQSIANTIKETIRETDIASRYGGEEFAILLPDTDREGVGKAAEKIRSAIASMPFTVPDTGIATRVTVSLGVSVFDGNRRDFFNAADRALYISKSKGKNQVNFALV